MFFSWVSAAEGSKWAEVVNTFTEEIRAKGPYQQYLDLAKIEHKDAII